MAMRLAALPVTLFGLGFPPAEPVPAAPFDDAAGEVCPPANAYLVFSGVTVLDVTAENRKTLVLQLGTAEDLCQTLAP